ncbi:unnamed protein product [Oppiella nova]|uniref:3'-phosphate/5'-hydroxy nucleic acid ligase n=1 Tax=Oppiella nova TaxID=334625 RepID=A0A7R9Q991_9ACAR|nr:unnamed protein product [Oppiella nova]CAG2155848.1 unnamed protein product [Oppiella nova]
MILNAKAEYGVPVKIYTKDVDEESLTQLRKMAQLQFIHSHIAVMPDVHLGKGATVGSVIPTKNAIIPAAVGVDIGCGGGNHFIELCIDENDDIWVMLHSGSRGLGNVIGTYFIERAKKEAQHRFGHVPDKDLSYFAEGSTNFDDYVEAVEWAQEYAFENRREMMRLILEAIRPLLPSFQMTKEAINCHHNYVQKELHFGEDVFVTRKGAIRAGLDEYGIIPGSMGAQSFIVKGKGNPDSFCSCSHGAGRKMSRSKAKHLFNQQDLIAQTVGIECRKDKGVVDEIPSAYKDIHQVMANQNDLIDVVHTLKQVLCIKG